MSNTCDIYGIFMEAFHVCQVICHRRSKHFQFVRDVDVCLYVSLNSCVLDPGELEYS